MHPDVPGKQLRLIGSAMGIVTMQQSLEVADSDGWPNCLRSRAMRPRFRRATPMLKT
jgi:hypothetical protein